jgi:hypothetical protein
MLYFSTPLNQLQPTREIPEPTRTPLCEICGDPSPVPVDVLDYGRMMLCDECRHLFGFDGGENAPR